MHHFALFPVMFWTDGLVSSIPVWTSAVIFSSSQPDKQGPLPKLSGCSFSHDATLVFYIIKNSYIMTSPTDQHQKCICVSVTVRVTTQKWWLIVKYNPLPLTISFGATTSIYQKTRRCPTAIISRIDIHLFLECDYGSCYTFSTKQRGSALCKMFLFLCAKMWPYSNCLAQDSLALLSCNWATCKHTKLHL